MFSVRVFRVFQRYFILIHCQRLVPSASVLFVSKASMTNGAIKSYNLAKRVEIVKDTRKVSKHDMKFNGSTPIMKIDPETFVSHSLMQL